MDDVDRSGLLATSLIAVVGLLGPRPLFSARAPGQVESGPGGGSSGSGLPREFQVKGDRIRR